ncbi:hypothetical protein ACVWWQ_001420 [Rhodanobacter sp. TND4EL1]
MSKSLFRLNVFLVAALTFSSAIARSYDREGIEMFRQMRKQPSQLARYQYLQQAMPGLSASNQLMAGQFRSFSLDELGLYNQAVLSFPLKSEPPPNLVLADRDEWKSADAVDVIAKLAVDRRIVLINEAHHVAHTRVLTLALLPRLRELGFKYFAAEALGDDDPGLMRRGYPIRRSGTEYLQEPLYGDVIREAIRLGFTIVPYDSTLLDPQLRDAAQANALFQKVFARDPQARLFVHAGYAHIDKARGRLDDIEPMAMKLAALTGFAPLSIDQTQFLESGPEASDAYHVLIHRFPTRSPEVLVNRITGKPWSALPDFYDMNVILPEALDVKTFGDTALTQFGGATLKNVRDPSRLVAGSMTSFNQMPRPKWLTLAGQRYPFPIDTIMCRKDLPCVVSAVYSRESDDATPADSYAFTAPYASSKLYLRPGAYQLHARNAAGKTLAEKTIRIKAP